MSDAPNGNEKEIIRQFRLVSAAALATLGSGMVFYHAVEKMSWVDALYFSTITLTTVGYGDIVPKTTGGKLFTTVYIILGVGIIASFANIALKRAVARRYRRTNK